jgi:hypothetical protein
MSGDNETAGPEECAVQRASVDNRKEVTCAARVLRVHTVIKLHKGLHSRACQRKTQVQCSRQLPASLIPKILQATYEQHNIDGRSRNYLCRGKAVSTTITYSVCMSVALIIQHAKRIRLILLSSVACPAVPYFSKLSHKRQVYQGARRGRAGS